MQLASIPLLPTISQHRPVKVLLRHSNLEEADVQLVAKLHDVSS
ncbi:hypothetical protein [Neobacillus terrae]|nr:hypothetical protein [Neobacillus terrae]